MSHEANQALPGRSVSIESFCGFRFIVRNDPKPGEAQLIPPGQMIKIRDTIHMYRSDYQKLIQQFDQLPEVTRGYLLASFIGEFR